MKMSLLREAFEAWISAEPYLKSITKLGAENVCHGSYKDMEVQLAWEAWQNSFCFTKAYFLEAAGDLKILTTELRKDCNS